MSIIKNNKRFIGQLHFDIVGGCQLRCVGCPNSTINPRVTPISIDDFILCLKNLDIDIVRNFRLFNYGEPLLHPDLPGIGRAIEEYAPFKIRRLEISTNAQNVDWPLFEEFLRQGRLKRLAVSCDGDGTPESYERLRPPARWTRLVDFLNRAARIRDRHCPDLEIITRTIINDPRDKERWLGLLSPLGITPDFRTWKYLPGAGANMTGREITPGKGVCFFVAEPQRLFVNHKGHVIPCCAHPGAGYFGDLKTDLYSRIFAREPRKDFIREMENKRAGMKICGSCEYGPPEEPGPSAGTGVER